MSKTQSQKFPSNWELFEFLGSAVIVSSQEMKILYLNHQAEELLKLKKENLINKDVRKELFGLFKEEKSCPLEELIKKGGKCEFDALLKQGDGNTFFAHVFLTTIKHENETFFLFNFFDITSQKELEKKLYHASITDYLTGLYNRRFMDEVLQQEMAVSKRYGSYFCILLIDLDNFKIVNDVYGHEVGDKVLIAVAKALKENVRASDVVARWGGEEFLILLRRINLEGALKVAEKIRTLICNLKVPPVESVTVSIGVSCYEGREDVYNVIRKADLALYQAKAQGKNCVILY